MKKDNIKLIINADDYAYFSCVTKGILDAGKLGRVTATGIMANSDCFDKEIIKLKTSDSIDPGVHLNLTFGEPLTIEMKNHSCCHNGKFPSKFTLAKYILEKKIDIKTIEKEFRAQIERCLNAGLKLFFLNSHEHIHMLPPVFQKTIALSNEYNIPFVRYTTAEWLGNWSSSYFIRNFSFAILNVFNKRHRVKNNSLLIGTSESGKLNYNYLEKRLSALKKGMIYELMCHPGYFDNTEITNPELLAYHDWEAELKLLTEKRTTELFLKYNIELVGYKDILNRKL